MQFSYFTYFHFENQTKSSQMTMALDFDIHCTLQRTLTLVITYEILNIGLSDIACNLLVSKPFQPYQTF